jgi:sRNA-binding carbon storage regulator CsrA
MAKPTMVEFEIERGQFIRIGERITVCLVKTSPTKARIGVVAPADVSIVRDELERLKGGE